MENEARALIFLAFTVRRPFTNHRVQGRATADFVTRQLSDNSVQPIKKRVEALFASGRINSTLQRTQL